VDRGIAPGRDDMEFCVDCEHYREHYVEEGPNDTLLYSAFDACLKYRDMVTGKPMDAEQCRSTESEYLFAYCGPLARGFEAKVEAKDEGFVTTYEDGVRPRTNT
jgi:hypothetical protein